LAEIWEKGIKIWKFKFVKVLNIYDLNFIRI